MAKYLGIDKAWRLVEMVRSNGGLRASFLRLFRTDDLKPGRLVGEDKYGNKYYENPYYFYGRNRWVIWADHVRHEYDGSMIPAEWFGWMHYKTDLPPDRDGRRPQYTWMADHTENKSGSPEAYVPYTTTPPKIEAWTPPKKNC